MGEQIKTICIKALVSVILGIIIQSVFPWNIVFLIPGAILACGLMLWKRDFIFLAVMVLSAINADIQKPLMNIPRTRDLLFKGVVILDDQRESGTRLSINLQSVICANDTISFTIPVEFYTYERKAYLGKTLLIKGRLSSPISGHRSNILSGKIIGEGLKGSFPGMIFNKVGSYVDDMLNDHLSKTNYNLASSLILGGSSRVGKELQDVFTRSGVLHILSVSGLHMGFVFTFVGLLLIFLPVSPKIKFIIIMLILFIYTGVTGFRPCVIRAGLMAFLFGLAFILQRHVDSMHILNITALVLLVISPATLYDLGAQLSFLSVYGILFLYPRIETAFINKLKGRTIKMLSALMAVSFSAQLFVSPMVIQYFHRVQTLAVFSNLIIVPLTSAITYLLFFSIIFGFIFAPGLKIIFAAISLLLKALVLISSFFAAIPFSSLSISISSVVLVLFYFLFVRRLRKLAIYAILAAVLAIILSEIPKCTIIIKTIESTVIEMPGGDKILISKKNNPADLFVFDISSVSYLIADRKICPYTKEFIRTPETLHYKRLCFKDLILDIERRTQISLGRCMINLGDLEPGDGRLVYILTNGSRVTKFERPVYCSLIEQLFADVRLLVAKYRLLFS